MATPFASVRRKVTVTTPFASTAAAVIVAWRPAPGVPAGGGMVVLLVVWPGTVVLVLVVDEAVCGPTDGRHVNLNLSLSVAFVVFAFVSSCAVPRTSSPFLSGPPTGTAKFTGDVQSDVLTGRPSAAT